jgi:hypothetical protein
VDGEVGFGGFLGDPSRADDRADDGGAGGLAEGFAKASGLVVVVGEAVPAGVLGDDGELAEGALIVSGDGDQVAVVVSGEAEVVAPVELAAGVGGGPEFAGAVVTERDDVVAGVGGGGDDGLLVGVAELEDVVAAVEAGGAGELEKGKERREERAGHWDPLLGGRGMMMLGGAKCKRIFRSLEGVFSLALLLVDRSTVRSRGYTTHGRDARATGCWRAPREVVRC